MATRRRRLRAIESHAIDFNVMESLRSILQHTLLNKTDFPENETIWTLLMRLVIEKRSRQRRNTFNQSDVFSSISLSPAVPTHSGEKQKNTDWTDLK